MGLSAYVEQNFGVWTVPGGMGRLAERDDQAARRAQGAGAAPAPAPAISHRGRPGGRRRHRPGVPRRRRRRGRRRPARPPRPGAARRADHARDPAGRQPPRPVRRRARPAARGRAARRPAARDPHQRHAPPRAVRPGRCSVAAGSPRTSCWRWPAARSTYAKQLEVRVDRSPRAQVEELAGSPYGVLWQGRATITRTAGPRRRAPACTPPGHTPRRVPGCRSWVCPPRSPRSGSARPERSAVPRPTASTPAGTWWPESTAATAETAQPTVDCSPA